MSNYMLQSLQECPCTLGSPDKYFKIKNCFNELTTEVLKANARYNLGIGDEWSLKWGNITGFIEELTDLTKYLDKFIIVYKLEISLAMEELQDKLEATILELVDLLAEDRRKIEALINSLEEFKLELRNLVEDKVDKSQIPEIQNPFNLAYTNIDNPNINNVGLALDLLLYKDLIITTKVNPNVAEIGDTISQVEFSWNYNKTITLQTFDSSNLDTTIRSKTISNIKTTTTKILSASDGRNTKSVSMNITFKLASYYGVSNKTTLTSEDIINSFTRDFNFLKGSTITVNALTEQYIYIMVPKSIGSLNFYVGGLEGGFLSSDFQFSRYGLTNDYILYRSDNSGLGTTTINVK